jgi:hypothetical protein
VQPTGVVLDQALAHYADHCAIGHANNGSGDTEIGRARTLPANTRYAHRDDAVKVEDIKPGTRVVVTAVEQKDKSMLAKTIEVGSVSAPAR